MQDGPATARSDHFSTRTVQGRPGRRLVRGYEGEADIFVVYCPENGHTYAVPVDEAPTGYMNLRVDPPLNGQERRVRWAHQYELPG
jgi:hypothetical protein